MCIQRYNINTNVKRYNPNYDIMKNHQEILLDFDDAEASDKSDPQLFSSFY